MLLSRGWTACVLLVACVSLAAAGPEHDHSEPTQPAGTDDAEARLYLADLASAWGPVAPEKLESFLAMRADLDPTYRKYENAAQQSALREVATRPLMPLQFMGLGLLRREFDVQLKKHALTFSEFRQLTMLVYGRWLRAVRDEPAPEIDVLRVLRELEVGLARRLENNPPEDPDELEQLQSRLERTQHHAYFLRYFAISDKKAVLDKIDPETKAWLERHRDEIEKYDYRYWDTSAPPRS